MNAVGEILHSANGISQNRKVAKFLQIELKQTERAHPRRWRTRENALVQLQLHFVRWRETTTYAFHAWWQQDGNSNSTESTNKSRDDHETGC